MIEPPDAEDVPPEVRRELVTRVLVLLETFNAEHGLGLDFPGRLELLELALDDLESALGDPTPPTMH